MNEVQTGSPITPEEQAEVDAAKAKVVGMDGKPKNNGQRRREAKAPPAPEPPKELVYEFVPVNARLNKDIIDFISRVNIFKDRFLDSYSEKATMPVDVNTARIEVRIEDNQLQFRVRPMNEEEKRQAIAEMEEQIRSRR